MRALRFTKIDYIKTKQQVLYILVVLAVVLLLMLRNFRDGFSPLVIFCYAVFMGIVFCTAPFGMCQRKDAGFLLLLPATTRDRILGRFLYGLSYMVLAALIGSVAMFGYRGLRGVSDTMGAEWSLCLMIASAGIVIVAVEYMFLYLFGENQSQNILGVVRVLPGMLFYFGSMWLMNTVMESPEQFAGAIEYIGTHLTAIGLGSAVAALAVLAVAVVLCVMVTEKRDY
ncbi:MAG: hypothetical protein HDR28_11365 [Lachnospiraceae bacterium]|nr:hypothetical protein [Lachnospiraceae bacterium]